MTQRLSKNTTSYIPVKIGGTYYNNPFFNIRLSWDHYFGNHDDYITIELEGREVVKARVDRIANQNTTPRIYILHENQRQYLKWINSTFKLNDTMYIYRINKSLFRIKRNA